MRMTDEKCRLAVELVRKYQETSSIIEKSEYSTKLVELMAPMVENGARGWRDTSDMSRDDVKQNLYVVLLKAAEEFPEGGSDFVSWFGVAARREIDRILAEDTGFHVPLSSARRQKKEGKVSSPESTSFDEILTDALEEGFGRGFLEDASSPDPEGHVVQEEMLTALRTALNRLGDEKKEFVLSVASGQDMSEVAFMTGETDYDLYRRYKAITAELRKELTRMGFDAEDAEELISGAA